MDLDPPLAHSLTLARPEKARTKQSGRGRGLARIQLQRAVLPSLLQRGKHFFDHGGLELL
jgi:hypothetical protein